MSSSSGTQTLPATRRKSIFVQRPETDVLRGRSPWFWFLVWLPALLACYVIYRESTPMFSSDNTSGWLRPLFERVLGRLADPVWWVLHHVVRKCGHFIGYGLVGLSFLRGWLYTLARRSLTHWRLRAAVFAVLSTAVVASLDEWHQTFLPSRTGLASDAVLDTCGAALLCAAIGLLARRPKPEPAGMPPSSRSVR